MALGCFSRLLWRSVGSGLLLFACAQLAHSQAGTQASPFAIKSVAGFEEPLLSTHANSPQEDQALASAIASFNPDKGHGVEPFDAFLAQYPGSGWRLGIQLNAGLWYYREGYFSRAIAAWENAWAVGSALQSPSPQARALADRAVGELLRMHARLGHSQRLKELLASVEGRTLVGPATEMVAGAKQGLWMMDNDPGVAFLCGPNALRRVALLTKKADAPDVKLLERYRSGQQGVSLAQVGELARAANLPYKPVFRLANTPIPVPSVVHWKVSHYAAIVAEQNGRYHIQDPTFGTDLWVSRDAVDKESTGFFLIAKAAAGAGWRDVTSAEANEVRGMGFTSSGDPNATREGDGKAKPDCGNNGMCGYNAHSLNVSLNLVDTPVGYQPAVGPGVFLRLVYNQREARQPAIPTFFNFGAKWTSNWLAYVVDVPNRPGINVMSYARGGGAFNQTGYSSNSGKFAPEVSDYSVLRLISADPIQYERRFRDGSTEVYASSDNASLYPRRVFLSQVKDPAGNAVSLSYDSSKRLTTLTDAVGRTTTFTYGSATYPLQPTRVTDPFGRFASIAYDDTGRLSSITDVIGLSSVMTYNTGSFITKLTTPYGESVFAYTENGADRSLNMTDPLGYTERVEARHGAPGLPSADPRGMPAGMDFDNQYLIYRNTFYWDKHAYNLAAGDYTKARIQHWYHDILNFDNSSTGMASSQSPLEGRVWTRTPNDSGYSSGTYDKPRQIGRVLDDGTSQVSNILYNKAGNVAAVTDPAGRYTQYTYAANGIDITRVRQRTRAGGYLTIAQYTYNSQHLPLTSTDAAGQVTQYAYNAAGQLTSTTNALGQISSYEYDALGQLKRAVNPNGKTAMSMTYDGAGRVATRTDSEGRTVSFSYDDLDRLTTATYPDSTSETLAYDKLDLASYTDRLNRATVYSFDANRRMTSVKDPLQRTVSFGHYRNGALLSLTDAKGNVTTWQRDLQSRVTAKTFADGTAENYTWETYGGRLKSRLDASGRSQTFGYRKDDLLSSISYAGGPVATPTVSFAYDAVFSRMTSMKDGTGTTSYQYGAIGTPGALQLVSEDGPYANDDITYAYDALGRTTQRAVAGSIENASFDALGRVTAGDNALGTLAYTYRGETGQMASQSIGTKSRTSFTYEGNNNDRRLKAIANLGTRGYQYTTNAQGLITSITDSTIDAARNTTLATRTWTPSYDNADRLLGTALSTGENYQYGYDAADNITSWTKPGGNVTAGYGVTNQMTTLAGAAVTQDAAGNLIEDGKRTYQWDAAGRLVTINYKGQPNLKSEFKYDGLGRRVAILETSGSTVTETRYLWCGSSLCQARDGSDVVTRRYFDEGEARPVTGAKNYYNRDHLGSVRNVSGVVTGNVLASLDYDPYGGLIKSTGTASSTDFRYAGMLHHSTSGLYLTQYRLYDPTAARWLSRDPIGEEGGLNLYGYVGGNPAIRTDRSGLLIDALADIGFIAYDVFRIIRDGDCNAAENWTALGADIVGLAMPGGTGFGLAVRAGRRAEDLAKGGTYVLRNADDIVVKTGRTNNLARREGELGRKHPDMTFSVDKRTDSYAAQRGREQIIHDANPSAHSNNGGLDRINGISPKNPKRDDYLRAGRDLP